MIKSILIALLVACLAATSALYALAAFQSLRKPMNVGADIPWAVAWVVFVLLAGVTSAIRPGVALRFWTACTALLLTAMIVMSGAVVTSLAAIWLLALAWGLGDRVLPGLDAVGSVADREIARLIVGIGLVCLIIQFVSLVHLLNRVVVWTLLAFLTALFAFRLPRLLALAQLLRREWRNARISASGSALISSACFVLLINIAWSLVPEVQFDALNYQLAVPRFYVEHGGIVDLPYFWHSYLSHLFNMLFALGLVVSTHTLPKLLTMATGLIATVAIYRLGARLFSRPVGVCAAVFFYTTPLVSWLSTTAYVDLPLTMFVCGAVLAHVCWRDSKCAAWLWASGASLGAALGTKLNGGFIAPVALLFVMLEIRERRRPAGEMLRTIGKYFLVIALFAVPSYAITYALTGNPIFPLMNGIFRSPLWETTNTAMNASLFGVGSSPRALLTLPVALTFQSYRFNEALPAGGLGPFLCLIPIALLLTRREARRRVFWFLLAIAGVYLAAWAVAFQYGRYYVPILPLVVLLSLQSLLRLEGSYRYVVTACLATLLLAQGALIPLQFWQIPERIPFRAVFAIEAKRDLLARARPLYRAVEYVNAVASPHERVIGVSADDMRYYLRPPMESFGETRALAWLGGPGQPEAIADALRARGYAYLLISRAAGVAIPEYSFLRPAFLDRYAILEFARGGAEVYRLSSETAGPTPKSTNLLANPGFEQLERGQPTGWWPYGVPQILRDQAKAHGGEVAIVATRDAGFSQGVPVSGGRLYTVGHFTRSDEAGQFARLQVNWLDAEGKMIDSSIDVVPVTSEWRHHSMRISAPSGSATAVLYASVHERSRVVFDDIWFGSGDSTR